VHAKHRRGRRVEKSKYIAKKPLLSYSTALGDNFHYPAEKYLL